MQNRFPYLDGREVRNEDCSNQQKYPAATIFGREVLYCFGRLNIQDTKHWKKKILRRAFFPGSFQPGEFIRTDNQSETHIDDILLKHVRKKIFE